MRGRVLAHHLIWTGYGHWLPNDPRGSGSKIVRSEILDGLGPIHYGRKAVQPRRQLVRDFYEDAHSRLKHAPLEFGDDQIALIGKAFGDRSSAGFHWRRDRSLVSARRTLPLRRGESRPNESTAWSRALSPHLDWTMGTG